MDWGVGILSLWKKKVAEFWEGKESSRSFYIKAQGTVGSRDDSFGIVFLWEEGERGGSLVFKDFGEEPLLEVKGLESKLPGTFFVIFCILTYTQFSIILWLFMGIQSLLLGVDTKGHNLFCWDWLLVYLLCFGLSFFLMPLISSANDLDLGLSLNLMIEILPCLGQNLIWIVPLF